MNQVKGRVKDCCREPANLIERPDLAAGRPGLTVRVCSQCQCRHFRLRAEAIPLLTEGRPAGPA